MSQAINRRKFCTNTALSATGIVLGNNLTGFASTGESGISSYDIMKDVMKYRKIDAHCHPDSDLGKQIDIANRLGIGKMQISNPAIRDDVKPEEIKHNNDIVLAAIKQYPDRYVGFFTLNPAYPKESLEELKRCVDQGNGRI